MKKRNGSQRKGHKSGKRTATVVQTGHRPSSTMRSAPTGRKAQFRQAVPAKTAARYSQDERAALALLLAPFMIVAATLAVQPSWRASPLVTSAPVAMPSVQTLPPVTETFPPATAMASARLRVAVKRAPLPPLATLGKPGELMAMLPAAPIAATALPPRIRVPVKRASLRPLATIVKPEDFAAPRELPVQMAAVDPTLLPPVVASPTPLRQPDPERRPAPVAIAPPSSTRPPLEEPGLCHAKPDLQTRARQLVAASLPEGGGPGRFGRSLAIAATAQLDDLVIYNSRYTRLDFPNGDVAALYGVCTDVVIRAYRTLGIDLQQLVYLTRAGRGDSSIDHRRVDVLRKFLEKHGEVLAISDLPEDYLPGDIVTYYRPQNRSSTAHIAVVTDLRAPSGRPLIVHNRGWGPQLEDALFVDKITGHYRYSGQIATPPTQPELIATRHLREQSHAQAAGKIAAVRSRLIASPKP